MHSLGPQMYVGETLNTFKKQFGFQVLHNHFKNEGNGMQPKTDIIFLETLFLNVGLAQRAIRT